MKICQSLILLSVFAGQFVPFGAVAALAIPDIAVEDLRPPVVQDAAGQPNRISELWPLGARSSEVAIDPGSCCCVERHP